VIGAILDAAGAALWPYVERGMEQPDDRDPTLIILYDNFFMRKRSHTPCAGLMPTYRDCRPGETEGVGGLFLPGGLNPRKFSISRYERGGTDLEWVRCGVARSMHVGHGGDELRTNYSGILVRFQRGASLSRGCAVGWAYRA
jgi:hypothetical protein